MAVLRAVMDGHRYGFSVIDHTGLPSGTVYPALATLSRKGFVTSSWEEDEAAAAEGRPRRRYYEATPAGAAAMADAQQRFRAMGLAGPLPADAGDA